MVLLGFYKMGSISSSQINFHGWLAGSNETKANSAQFEVKLATGAELGNILICCARHRARERYSDESSHIYRHD